MPHISKQAYILHFLICFWTVFVCFIFYIFFASYIIIVLSSKHFALITFILIFSITFVSSIFIWNEEDDSDGPFLFSLYIYIIITLIVSVSSFIVFFIFNYIVTDEFRFLFSNFIEEGFILFKNYRVTCSLSVSQYSSFLDLYYVKNP